MNHYCLGFEKLADKRGCSLCKVRDIDAQFALAFYRYENGYTKFDVVDTSDKRFPGIRVDVHFGFMINDNAGLNEAIDWVEGSSRYKEVLRNLNIKIVE